MCTYASVCIDNTKQSAKAPHVFGVMHTQRKKRREEKKIKTKAKVEAKLCTIGDLEVRTTSTFLTKIIPP